MPDPTDAISSINQGGLPPGIASNPAVQLTQQAGQDQAAAVEKIQKAKQDELAPIQQDIQQRQKKLSDMADKGPDQVALPENQAKHLDPKQLSDSFSTFMTLGALAGLLTRAPMTAALNNMTAAINGVQAGDKEQFDKANDEFKQNFQKAMDTNKQRMEEYNRIFNNGKMSLDEKMTEAKMVALKYDDQLNLANLRAGNAKDVIKSVQSAQTLQQKAQEHYDQMQQQVADRQERARESDSRVGESSASLAETIRYHDAEIAKMQRVAEGKEMTPTMKKSVELDIGEVKQSLQQLSSLKSETGSPFFSQQRPGMWSSLVGKAATPSDMQVYDVYANRIAVALASIQSMGRGQVSDSKVAEARKLVPTLGDSEAAIKAKLSQIDKIANMADNVLKGKDVNSGAGKTIVRTGTLGGKKVVQYSDGTTDYAD